MSTLGQRLKAEREKRQLTIEKLAAETRIHARHFDAIEEDRISDLPSGFFYRSFVRQYARILDLPESEYQPFIQLSLEAEAQELDSRRSALPQRNIVVPPMPTGRFDFKQEVQRWLVRLAGLIVVIAGSAGLFYLYQTWRSAPPAAPATETVAETQKPAAKPESAPAVQPPAEPAADASQTQALATPQSAEPQASSAQPAVAAQPAAQPPAPQTTPPANPAVQPQAALNLTVGASADSWIQVTADGKTVFMDVLRPGQARSFRAGGVIRLKTGNAGGLSMEFNGSAVPPAGPIGQVRTIEFTSQGVRVIPPPLVAPQVTPLPVPVPDQQN
jgi:cytoskeleton protein RodZ